MASGHHVLVADWLAEDLDLERRMLAESGISLAESGVDGSSAIEAKKQTLLAAIRSTPRIDALMFCIAPIDADVIGALPAECRLLQRGGIGLDNVDMGAARHRRMMVRNTPNYCIEEVAVHTMAMLLHLHRQLGVIHQRIRDGHWSGTTLEPVQRLSTLTLGIMGFGRIGRKLGDLMTPMVHRVIYHDPVPGAAVAWADAVDLDHLLAASDLVALHLPLTGESRHIINRSTLAQMKKTAIVVNTARGALVDAEALVEALNGHRLGGAGLDVFDPEIPSPDSPLRNARRLVLTSHVAWYSEQARHNARTEAVQSVIELVGGSGP